MARIGWHAATPFFQWRCLHPPPPRAHAVGQLTAGSETVKREAEATIAQYAEQHRSSIAQNAARAAAAEVAGHRQSLAASSLHRGGPAAAAPSAAAPAASATSRQPAAGAGALTCIADARRRTGATPILMQQVQVGSPAPLTALRALRASLEHVALQRRTQMPQPKASHDAPLAALPVICPHVPLPMPVSLPVAQPLQARRAWQRASGVRPVEFWQRELG